MVYYDYISLFDAAKQGGMVGPQEKMSEWYESHIRWTMQEALVSARPGGDFFYNLTNTVTNVQLDYEFQWEKLGRVYYKVHPGLLPYFAHTKLDVPSEYLALPFPAFTIRLPEEHDVDCLKINDDFYVKSIMVGSRKAEQNIVMGNGEPTFSNQRQLILFIDINEKEPGTNIPQFTYQQLLFDNDEMTVEQSLNKLLSLPKYEKGITECGVFVPNELLVACLRIAVAVCFLATGSDKLICPDVLNRDSDKYEKAKKQDDQKTMQTCENRAKRNRKHGFTIGHGHEMYFAPRSDKGHDDSGEGGHGQELQFQHQRSAHWHWVRHGPGKALMKLMFYGQKTVRPDLPINPNARRGYKSKGLT